MDNAPNPSSIEFRKQNYPLGVTALLGQIALAIGVSAVVKMLSVDISVAWILFFRYLGCLPLLLVFGLWQQGTNIFMVQQKSALLIRSIVGLLGLSTWYLALSYIEITTTTALVQTTPIIICLLAPVLLGEMFGLRRFGAVLLGFVGVFVLLYPELKDNNTLNVGILFALSSAFFSGLMYIFLRKLAHKTHPVSSALSYNFFAMIITGIYCLLFEAVPENLENYLLLLLLIGVISSGQQFLMAFSHTVASATSLTPIHYFSVPFSLVVGIVYFDETISLNLLWGSALIVGAGGYIFWREQQLARKTKAT